MNKTADRKKEFKTHIGKKNNEEVQNEVQNLQEEKEEFAFYYINEKKWRY